VLRHSAGSAKPGSDTGLERGEIYVESVSSDGSKVMGGGDYASSKVGTCIITETTTLTSKLS